MSIFTSLYLSMFSFKSLYTSFYLSFCLYHYHSLFLFCHTLYRPIFQFAPLPTLSAQYTAGEVITMRRMGTFEDEGCSDVDNIVKRLTCVTQGCEVGNIIYSLRSTYTIFLIPARVSTISFTP